MIDGRLGRQRYLEVAVGTVMLTHVYKPSRGATGLFSTTVSHQIPTSAFDVVCVRCADLGT